MDGGLRRQIAWWKRPDGEIAQAVCDRFRALDRAQNHHRLRNLRHLRQYSNRLAASLSNASFSQFDPYSAERTRRNVCQAIVDAAVSQAAADEIRPMPLTIEGDWQLVKKAKLMQKYFDGEFYSQDVHELDMQRFQDACMYGTGFLKAYAAYGKVVIEKVHPNNWVVDDVEAQMGWPLVHFEYKEISRDEAMDTWGKKNPRVIQEAGLVRREHWGRMGISDPISVIYAWKLPPPIYRNRDEYKRHPGTYVVVTDKGLISRSNWVKPRPPVAVMRWKNPGIGFYGMGLCEEVTPHQVEINATLMRIQHILWHANVAVWAKHNSVQSGSVSNRPGEINFYKGDVPPTHIPINTGVGDLYAHADRTYQSAFEDTGVSFMHATAQVPNQLESGEAQRVHSDIGSARFMHVMKRRERSVIRLAHLLIDAERDLIDAGQARSVIGRDHQGLHELNFEGIDIADDKYQLQVFPTSFLPHTPQGKIDRIKDLAEISPQLQRVLMRQLDFPDIEHAVGLVNAHIDVTEMAIDRIINDGTYVTPEPFWDLEFSQIWANAALLRAETRSVPEERLEMLRDFIDQCVALEEEKQTQALAREQQMAQAAQLAPLVPGMPPQAPPGASPQIPAEEIPPTALPVG